MGDVVRVGAADAVEILVLGPVVVRVGETPYSPPSAMGRAILGALTVAGDAGLSSGALFSQIWGERSITAPASTLTVAVSRLRRWLREIAGDDDGIVTTATGYALGPDAVTTDLHRFRRLVADTAGLEPAAQAGQLRDALALWRGSALADVPLVSSDAAVLDGLERERVTATIACARALLATGQGAAAVAILAEPAAHHPFDEALNGVYIEALAAEGRQGEALRLYDDLRTRLRTELGVDPGRELAAIFTRVLRQETGRPAPAGEEMTPAELPPDVVAFTGRDEQLRALDRVLDRDLTTAPVIALTGMAGVGKTSLAVRWVHRVRGSFPDGQLYVDLHGYSPQDPVATADVLGRFLGKLGVPVEQRPAHVDDAAAMYRSLLADKQLVTVLDNASHARQVRPLLPNSPKCVAVVTSRDRLDGLVARDGAVPVVVDVLAPEEAGTLLTSLLGEERLEQEPAAVEELATACGRLPLALRIAAAQLAYQPNQSVQDYLTELRDRRIDTLSIDDDDAASLRATFDLSHRQLSHDAKTLFHLLATSPCLDLPAGAATALIGAPPRDAGRLLRQLVRAHLLIELEPGRYGFHDLLRAYAAEARHREVTDTVRQAAISRLVSWYEATAAQAARSLDYVVPVDPGTETDGPEVSPQDARTWMFAEYENVVALVHRAADDDAYQQVWRIVHYVHRRYADLGRDSWRDALTRLMSAMERTGTAMSLAVVEQAVARTHQVRNELAVAVELRRRALEHCREGGWTSNEAMALGDLGTATLLRGDLEQALTLLRDALDLSRRRGDEPAEAVCSGDLGYVYHRLGDLAAAEQHAKHALHMARRLGNRTDEVLQLSNVGCVLHSRGRLTEARDCLERTRAMPHLMGAAARANVLDSLAEVYRDLGMRDGARQTGMEAVREATRSNSPRMMATTAITMASVECRLGDYRAALRRVTAAHQQAVTVGAPDLEARALVVLADVHQGLGDHSRALPYAEYARQLAQERGLSTTAANAQTRMAQITLRTGGGALARRLAEEALQQHHAIGHQVGEARTLWTLAEAVATTDGVEAAAPYLRSARAVYARLDMPEAAQVDALLDSDEQADI